MNFIFLKSKFHILSSLLISFFIFFISSENLVNIKPLKSIDQKIIDSYLSRRGIQKSIDSLNVILIGISNETIKELPPPYNSWPIARNLFSKAIENLSRAGAKVIGIDLLFSEADKYSPNNDSLLFKTIKKYRNVVLAGKLEQSDWRFKIEGTSELKYGNLFYAADSSIGIVNVLPDDDGALRNYIPYFYDETTGKKIPSFAFAVLQKYFNLSGENLIERRGKYFSFSDLKIPAKTNNTIFINYYGPEGTFKKINFIDIIDDKSFKTKTEIEVGDEINTFDDPETGLLYTGIFRDKIVLMGSIEPEDKDLFTVPVSPEEDISISGNLMYGVEIHANVIQMIIDKNFIREGSWVVQFLSILILTFLGLNIFEKIRSIKFKFTVLAEFLNLILVLVVLYILYESHYYIFLRNNLILFFIPPGLGIISAYIGSSIADFLKERKQKMMIKGMFSQYLNPELVNELINHPEKLKLGGVRKNMTVLFSDLANFTTISEKTEPEILVEMLNKYFDEMTEIIFDTKGTLDKFEGDAIMAFWNAPLDDEYHHYNASLAAIKMKKRVEELRNEWKSVLGFDFSIRIGINSGEMIVGNMGGRKKFDYTVMGDNVNLASRLEAINKIYGTEIIISEFVQNHIKDFFFIRELDLIIVKGKTIPVKIFQLIDLKNQPIFFSNDNVRSLTGIIEYFESGLNFYRDKKFLRAIEEFEKVLLIDPDDKPTKIFIDRCFEYLNSPPPEDWNGVFESKIK